MRYGIRFQRRDMDELHVAQLKFEAWMLLLGNRGIRTIVEPTANEWIGINLLAESGEIPPIIRTSERVSDDDSSRHS